MPAVWKQELTKANREMGELWHRRYAPLHFQSSAHEKYGYDNRTERYKRRKRALARSGQAIDGGNRDLVLSGRMKEMLLGSATIRANDTGVTVNMPGPYYMTLKPKVIHGHVTADKYREVTTVSDEEQEELAAVQAKAVSALDAYRAPKHS